MSSLATERSATAPYPQTNAIAAPRPSTQRVGGPRIAVVARYQYRQTSLAAPSARVIVLRLAGAGQELWDEPAQGPGPRYLIEPSAEQLPDEERDALITEYLQHAASVGHPPLQPTTGGLL